MRILFARHGQTDWNVRLWVQGGNDIPLNAAGAQHARALGEALAGEPIVRVYASELLRAKETAALVARRLGVDCRTRAGLQEMGLGEWEGHTWTEIAEGWPELYAVWNAHRRHTRPPGGETYAEVLARFVGAVLGILREAQGDVLVVTHSACIQIFLAELNGTPLESMSKDYPAPNAEAIAIEGQRILDRFAG